MIRPLGIVAVLSIAIVPLATAATRQGGAVTRGGEAVVEGVIARTNPSITHIVLEDGTVLTVPPSVTVPRNQVTPRRSIKAYYENRGGENVVTMLFLQDPRQGGGA